MADPASPPTPEQRKQFFAGLFDRLSESYDSVGVDYFTTFGRRLVELAGVRPGEHVLDLGCGRGAVTFAAAEAVGPDGRVTALDLAPGMVERTAAEARERGYTWVDVRVGDAEAPDFPDGATFDVLLSGLVLFFLPDPVAALRSYAALLPAGGRLGLTTFPPQEDTWWGEVGKRLQDYVPGGRRATRPDTGPLASPEALAQAVRDAGFADVTTTTEAHDTSFRDLDHWWTWAWSHGQRAALERVPGPELEPLRQELYGLLRPHLAADGSLPLRQLITYTVATR
jgi:ubiquinone/menaquinone biosynthesis C-methylase UbiE